MTLDHDSKLKEQNIVKEMKDSFLDYAMSVIVSRALPDVRDGMKPVHRRILYGMNNQGMTPDKPYKKSARIVGDVMGNIIRMEIHLYTKQWCVWHKISATVTCLSMVKVTSGLWMATERLQCDIRKRVCQNCNGTYA